MTIVEAIKAVMQDGGKSMTAKEAYEAITKRGLYIFKAKHPEQLVLREIRRHCEGLNLRTAASVKHFRMAGDNRYLPLEAPIRESVHG